jgi:TPP-dependent pyruvate/acetoin dehydrogenase alpha subunit
VAQEAIRRAREGHGPALIECVEARANGPAKVDVHDATAQNDSLSFMEQYLRRRDLWSEEWARSIVAGFTHDLDEAFAALHEPVNLDGQFDNVYSSDIARPHGESQARLP